MKQLLQERKQEKIKERMNKYVEFTTYKKKNVSDYFNKTETYSDKPLQKKLIKVPKNNNMKYSSNKFVCKKL